MMKIPHVTLEQWRVLQAIVDCGGFAQAAEKLHRSQSSVSYTIARLQEQLGIPLLVVKGRKAELTEAGIALLGRSRQLLKDAIALESIANNLEQGWESEIKLVVDAAFPSDLLIQALKVFAPHDRGTRVQLQEVVLSGANDALNKGTADIVIGATMPEGYLSDLLVEIEFVAVAHPEHPLHSVPAPVSMNDLERHLQVVIRDSGETAPQDFGWLGAEHRWTVTSIDTAITTISNGLGFGWLPKHRINHLLKENQLKPLSLKEGSSYKTYLYLTYGSESPGPATTMLGEIITETVQGTKSNIKQA